MRKLIILFTLIVTGCATSGGSTPTSFEFYKNADHDGDKLIANTFYSVYGIYHTLGEVNLHNLFPVGDVNRMVLKIVKSLEQGEAIQMQVPNMTGKRTLIVTFRTDFETDTDLPSVFITTNYNQDKEKAVPL
ncbi:MAG: hypothetical protein GWN00_05305, partial [Aliifodinibius sp.]|nr:hypothetical protein [candidate division Zixibacteria bacterium]NIT55662.1 hypothetical protein [Fodinibius sp.]NIV10631.1 hypothetical protein [Fodinibius sp.]NIY24246.1 hypothetical protein [Fodinibius sp.]